jgi:hypothetical protein
MYDQTIDARQRPTLGHQSVRSGLALVPLLLALGFVLFTTLRSPLKDDIAWLLYVAREWLAGRQLYLDLIEVNPPMIVWVLALPAALSATLGVTAKFVAVPFFAACMMGCAGWCAKLLRGTERSERRRSPFLQSSARSCWRFPDQNSGSVSICSRPPLCLISASSRVASTERQRTLSMKPSPGSLRVVAARSNPSSWLPLPCSKSSAGFVGYSCCGA